ncbi:hypothetical protein ACVJGD_000454 [Bradyrhizobium sp. USDA 10063]
MFKIIARAWLLALAVSVAGASGAKAAVQAPVTAALLAGAGVVTPATFWAQPYPYKYVPWRRCPRVRVETPYGWYWDRVCGAPVLRRSY